MGNSPQRLDAPREGDRRREVRRRHPAAGDALRAHPAAAGARREAREGRHHARPRRLPGVTVVNEDGLVAVLHADPEAAAAALALVKAEWDAGPAGRRPGRRSSSDLLAKAAARTGEGDARATSRPRAPPRPRRFEHTYQKGYVAHAPIEPHAALAEVEDGKLTVWASTQTPFPTRDRIAQPLGARPEERPRDHALRRRRLRRQERRPAGRRGGAPRQDHRQAGAGRAARARRSSSTTPSTRPRS